MDTEAPHQLIRSIIQRIAVGPDRGKDISSDEAHRATQALLDDQLDPVQAGIFLIGLRMKRETLEEYSGVYQALRESTESIQIELSSLLYLADPFDGYARHLPVSPFIPSVLSACGHPSIMQGVKEVGPKFGITAHRVYAAAGCNTKLTTEEASNALINPSIGWAYLDQQQVNPKLFALGDFRDRIVKRTALTTLERLLLPIKAQTNSLVLGYVHKAYPDIYAQAARQAGFSKAVLIKGLEGGVTPALNKPLRSYIVTADQLSEKSVNDHLFLDKASSAGTVIANLDSAESLTPNELDELTLEAGIAALSGKSGLARDQLILSCATALSNLSTSPNWVQAIDQISDVLDSGKALERFERYRDFSQSIKATN